MRPLVLGNWKMNGSVGGNLELLNALTVGLAHGTDDVDVGVCVPAVFVPQMQQRLAGGHLAWGAQDVSAHVSGAYTGEVSAPMLREFGVRYVLVGHSERRQYHAESDAVVAAKAQQALSHGLTPVVCLGETLAERDANLTDAVVRRQLAAVVSVLGPCSSEIVVAYEPVWAIGTGRTATPEQAQAVHAALRQQLRAAHAQAAGRVRIVYGGSMNASNANDLLAQPEVDGGLVGGASLKAAEFLSIVKAAAQRAANRGQA
jgi:triosephosphate isomerase (TIM)